MAPPHTWRSGTSVRTSSQATEKAITAATTALITPTTTESTSPMSSVPENASWNADKVNHSGPWSNSRGEKATARKSMTGSASSAMTTTQKRTSGAARKRESAIQTRSPRRPCRRLPSWAQTTVSAPIRTAWPARLLLDVGVEPAVDFALLGPPEVGVDHLVLGGKRRESSEGIDTRHDGPVEGVAGRINLLHHCLPG